VILEAVTLYFLIQTFSKRDRSSTVKSKPCTCFFMTKIVFARAMLRTQD